MKFARHIYPSLVMVQPRKTRPCLSERLLMGRKESNKKNNVPGDRLFSGVAYVTKQSADFALDLTLKASAKMHLIMSSAEVVCCK